MLLWKQRGGEMRKNEHSRASETSSYKKRKFVYVSELLFMAGKKLAISNAAALFSTEVTLYDTGI
jgi:hypothetical protein